MARLARKSDKVLGYSKQSTQGAINASPAFTPYNRSSGGIKKAIGYTQDDTISNDQNAMQNIQDTTEITAEVESSAQKQTVDLLISCIHGTETVFSNTATSYAALADGLTVSATAYAALSVNDVFWVTGFSNPLLNTMYIVASKEASNKVVTYTAPAATESAGASVTLKSNKTKNADTTSYYTLQEKVYDTSAAGNTSHKTTYDNVIDTGALTIGETGIIKNTFGFLGEQEVSGVAAISGQTYGSVPTDQVLSAVQNVMGFYVDYLSQTCKVKSLGVNWANNYEGDDAAGCQKYYARGASPTLGGDIAVRARVDQPLLWKAYYEAGTRKAIGVLLQHSSTEQTFISIPRVVITEHDNPEARAHEMTYAAEGDSTTSATMIIFRNWV